MPLFARSFQELMQDSIEDLANNTNITRLTAGGIARALLEAFNKRLEEAYQIFDLNLARAFVSSAPGQYLELIGTLLGVERFIPVAANTTDEVQAIKFYVATGLFGAINNGQPMSIPRGTIISTEPQNGGVRYRLTEEALLSINQNTAWVSAEAANPGENSNLGTGSLIYHDFLSYTQYQSETLLVTNVHPIANGKNFESDANYRYRIINRVLEAEAANETAIRLAILSTPGVADVVLIRRYRGIGTLGAIIKSVLPTVSQSLIDDVTVNVEKVQAYGDIAYICKPFETGITMELTVHYSKRLPDDELSDIEANIEREIVENINDLDIGEILYVNKLIADLFAVSDNISNFGVSGQPIDKIYVHKESKLRDNKVRQTLLGDYTPEDDERIIIEPSVLAPITISREFVRR